MCDGNNDDGRVVNFDDVIMGPSEKVKSCSKLGSHPKKISLGPIL